MSKGVERLLRKMMSPNADLRVTSSEAMQDSYWVDKPASQHKTSSAILDAEINLSKLLDTTPPWSSSWKGKNERQSMPEQVHAAPSLSLATPEKQKRTAVSSRPIARVKSYAQAPSLSPVKASPRSSPKLNENISPRSKARHARGLSASLQNQIPRKPVPMLEFSPKSKAGKAMKPKESKERNRKAKILADVTSRATNNAQEKQQHEILP